MPDRQLGTIAVESSLIRPAHARRCRHRPPRPLRRTPSAATSARSRTRRRAAPLFHITELSHVIHRSGDRPGRPFEQPENDRRRGGRRQERLARRNDQPARRRRHPRARRLRDHRARVPRVPRAGRPRRRASRSGSRRSMSTTSRRSPRPAREIRGWIVERAAAAGARAAIARRVSTSSADGDADGDVRRALVGHRRGPARCVVRRTAGNLPQHHRHRQCAARDEGGICLASTTTARSPTACTRASPTPTSRCRPACSAWCAATSARAGVMFTLDTESGFDDVVFITSSLRPRRDRRAGRGEPRRVLRLQAEPRGRAGRRSCARASARRRSDGLRRRAGRRGQARRRPSTCRRADRNRFSHHRRRRRTSSRATR